MPDSPISSHEAYLAMFSFLEDYYNRTKSDEIGSMLSGLCLMSDGKPMDPAYWSEWEEAVRKALNGEVDAEMRLSGGGRSLLLLRPFLGHLKLWHWDSAVGEVLSQRFRACG